jgi:hypothetical protein
MFTSTPRVAPPGLHSSVHRPAADPRPGVVTGRDASEWRHGERHEVSRASAHGTPIDLGRSPAAVASVTSIGWLLSSLLGVLSCNSVLGIGEASLECDSAPCATDIASAAGSPAGGVDTRDAGATGGVSTAGNTETPLDLPVSSSTPASPASSAPAASAGGGGASSGLAPDSGAPVRAAPPALCSSGDDACGTCLCDACEDEVARCAATPGCFEIVACARLNACVGFACFCGSIDVIACATSGAANGPCLAPTLAAPGSRLPTLANPSAGPASDAALALANCSRQSCFATCRN